MILNYFNRSNGVYKCVDKSTEHTPTECTHKASNSLITPEMDERGETNPVKNRSSQFETQIMLRIKPLKSIFNNRVDRLCERKFEMCCMAVNTHQYNRHTHTHPE